MDMQLVSELVGTMPKLNNKNIANSPMHPNTNSPNIPVPVAVPVALNNVPKNTFQKIKQVAQQHAIANHQIAGAQDLIKNDVIALNSDYYSIFGFQLSKTTIYLVVIFIVLIVIYYIYKYFTSSASTQKNKRKQEVSFDQQSKSSDNDDDNDNDNDNDNNE